MKGEAVERHDSRRRSRSRGDVARRRSRKRSPSGEKESSSADKPSSGSWNVDRGRSRVRRPSNPVSEDNLRRRGYHALFSSFDKVFYVEKRWKMVRDMGSGAYGTVISAADEISGETVAIKQVTRVFEKVSLAKRALREITLLRHFSNHENITGLIDVDAISRDFSEVYLFMEPMEADVHQILKSGQPLTNEHVQYFVYQILRGMKYVHSANVVHRDLKPGNLLVNADCELKICDFGLSRGFDDSPDENAATHMTEYVATRWYRAPEIMLAFKRYNTKIDVWSIGCILAELIMGRPLFKGKDYIDQLNKILDVLGTPSEEIISKIGSERAQAYVRSLPIRQKVPYKQLMPDADPLGLDLLEKLLAFDPLERITVDEALVHPYLATYHDVNDEPICPAPYEKWREIEKLTTIEEFREALWNEIEEYRHEVRSTVFDFGVPSWSIIGSSFQSGSPTSLRREYRPELDETIKAPETVVDDTTDTAPTVFEEPFTMDGKDMDVKEASLKADSVSPVVPPAGTNGSSPNMPSATLRPGIDRSDSMRPPTPADMKNDPMVSYARRSSILQSQYNQHQLDFLQGNSSSVSPSRRVTGLPPHQEEPEAFPGLPRYSGSHIPSVLEQMREGMPTPPPPMAPSLASTAGPSMNNSSTSGTAIPFPTFGGSYIVPARSRTASTAGGDYGGYGGYGASGFGARKLLRTLSTVSIHESVENVEGGLAAMGPIGQAIIAGRETAADAPASVMPRDFATVKEEEEQSSRTEDGSGSSSARSQKEVKSKDSNGASGTSSGTASGGGTPAGGALPISKKKERRFILF